MNDNIERLSLPEIESLGSIDTSRSYTYFGAAGFEDRSVAFLERCTREGIGISEAVSFKYLPHVERNRNEVFSSLLQEIGVKSTRIHTVIYDRFNPEVSAFEIRNTCKHIVSNGPFIVDISGMSKFLIITLLNILKGVDSAIRIIYTEAERYYPTHEEFCSTKWPTQEPNPVFLTDEIRCVVTTQAHSSTAMQGSPVVLVAFPTFNHRALRALTLEVLPQRVITIEGVPPRKKNKWRQKAIRRVNKQALSDISDHKSEVVSTFDYLSTIKMLENIYRMYSSKYKIVIAPTGSKLQALAVYFFAQMHPDVQLVYPVVESFKGDYTEGIEQIWTLCINNFLQVNKQLDSYRWQDVNDLQDAISKK